MSTFPSPDSGPQQVREYIAQILITHYDASAEFARDTAELWRLGRGVDLLRKAQEYADDGFREVFGDSVGHYLHRTARDDMVAQWSATTTGQLHAWGIIVFPVTIALLSIWAWRQPSKEEVLRSFFYVSWLGPLYMICSILGLQNGLLVSIFSLVVAVYVTMAWLCLIVLGMKKGWDAKAQTTREHRPAPKHERPKKIE